MKTHRSSALVIFCGCVWLYIVVFVVPVLVTGCQRGFLNTVYRWLLLPSRGAVLTNHHFTHHYGRSLIPHPAVKTSFSLEFSRARSVLTDLVTCWSFQTTMSRHEEFNERLDTEFDHFLLDMKPYVLKNPSKAGEVGFTVVFGVED